MSNSVDTRVVEMQFNNQDFEKNINTSLNTLDKLKSALNFGKSAQSLTQLQTATNNVDFSPFSNALEGIQSRFSALGVVGMTVISNLTTGIMNKAKSILTAIPRQISEGGLARAMNIENAKFQLKGLGIAWKDIEEDINYGVKDTAYGLDAAAKAASQLVASNVNLGDEMKESLRAISGVAAMTNASYEEISPIFTTVAGQGKLMTMQLRQLESRGLNVAASLGKSMGKTEEEIRDMVTKGKIDFKTFSHYMNEAFGDHAKKANETYSGSLGNVKAALSRIGAEFKTSRLENLRNIFVSAIPAINKFKADISQATTFINFLSSMISGKLASAIESIDFGPIMEKANGLLNNLDLGSGIKYSDISNLLGKVKEEGVLTTKTLKETEKMGLNVTSVLAKSFGKTEKEIRKDIKNGQIDYTRFAAALGMAVVDVSKLGKVFDTIGSKAKELLEPVVYIFKQLGSIVKNAFVDISTGLQKGFKVGPLVALNKIFLVIKTVLNDIGYALHTFLNYMAESGNSEKVIIFFQGLGNVLLSLYDILLVVSNYAGRAFRKIFFIGDEATVFSKAIDLVCDILEKLGKIMLHSEDATVGLLNTIVNFGSKTIEVIKNGFEPLITTFETLSEKTDKLTDSTSTIGKVFETIKNGLASIGAFVGDALSGLWDNLVKPFESNNANFILSFISALEVGLTSLLSLHFIDKLADFSNTVTQFKGILGTITKPFFELRVTLQAYQKSLKAGMLLKIGEAVLMLAGAMFLLSTIDKDRLVDVTVAMTEMMYALVGAFGLLVKFINTLQGGFANIGKISAVQGILISLGVALLLLSIAAKKLSSVDWEDLKHGIMGLGAIMAELLAFLNLSKLDKGAGKGTAMGLIGIAAAVYILAAALEKLSAINPDTLGSGLGSMAAIFGMLGIFTNIVNPNKIIATGVALNLIAVSLLIFAKGLTALGEIPLDTLKQGLISMALALGAVAVALLLIPDKGSIGKGAGLVLVAASMLILAKALEAFGSIPLENIKNGLIGLGGALGIIAVAMLLMKNAIPGALALLVVSGALTVLAGVLKGLSAVDPGKMVIALLELAGALAIIVVAGYAAQGAALGLMALGAAIVMIGAGVLMAGTGLLAFNAGLAMLVAMGTAGIATLTAALTAIINLIPIFMAQLGYGIVALLDVLSNSLDSFVKFGVTMLTALMEGIIQTVPKLMETLRVLLDAVITLVTEFLPKIVDLGLTVIFEFLRGVEEALPELVDRAFTIMITFIDSLSAAVEEHGDELVDSIWNLFVTIIKKIWEVLTDAIGSIWEKGKELGSRLLDGIKELKDGIVNWFKEKFEAVKAFFTSIAVAFWNDGKGIGSKLLDGIKELKDGILNWFKEKIQAVKDWFGGLWGDFKDAGANLIHGLVSGLESVPVLGSVIKLGRNIKNAFNDSVEVHSPSKATERTGKYFVQGFVVGIEKNAKQVERPVKKLGRSVIDIFNNEITTIGEITKGFYKGLSSKQIYKGLSVVVTKPVKELSKNEKILRAVKKYGIKVCQNIVLGLEEGKKKVKKVLNGIISIFDINGAIVKFTKTSTKGIKKEIDKLLKTTAKSFKDHRDIIDEYISDYKKYRTIYKTLYYGLNDNIKTKKIKVPKTQTKVFKTAAKAIGQFGVELYKNSDVYKDTVNNIKVYNKVLKKQEEQLKKLKEEQPKLTKEITKHNKKVKKLAKEEKALEKQKKKLQEESKNASKSRKKEIEKEIKEIDKQLKKNKELSSKEQQRLKDSKKELEENKKNLKQTTKDIKDLNKLLKKELLNVANGPKTALKEYKNTIKEMVKSSSDLIGIAVTNHVDLFESFEKQEALSAEALLKNMQSQIIGVNEWQNDLDKLAKKGLNKGLIERLREMGPEGAKYIKAFLSMTNEEIKKANLMYKAEGQLVGEQMVNDAKAKMEAIKQWSANITALSKRGLSYDVLKDLVDQGYDNAEYVQALVNMTDDQLMEMSELYVKEDKLPNTIANNVAAALAYALKNNEEVIDDLTGGGATAVASVIKDSFLGQSDEVQSAGSEIVTALADGIADSAQVMLDATRLIGDTTVNTFREYFNTDNGTTIGVEITAGIVTGLITGKDAVAAAAEELAQTIDGTVSDELEIHSPSKKMITIGKFINEGLANGLKKYSTLVVKSATEVGTSTKNTIADTINAISSFFDNDFNQPVIRPTLDLSDISKNANRIDNMFNSGVSLFGQTGENGEIQNGKVFNFTQNNYSPKALPRIEIYRQTRNQFSAMKGLV